MTLRSLLATGTVAVVVGCAAAASPEVLVVPAGPDALRCGARAVEGLGYETRRVAPGVVEGNQVIPGVPGAADRHVVELTVDGDPPRLVATVSRWRYEPSEHTLPIRRQAVTRARPEPGEVEAVRAAVEECRPDA